MPVEFLTRTSESVSGLPALPHQVSVLSMEEQLKRLDAERHSCEQKIATESYILTGVFCNRTWDNILCWPDTPAGHVARQPCPEYINMFDQGEFVTRQCTENGSWWVNPYTHQTWSNYSACDKTSTNVIPELIREHMPGIKLMYTIGYSVSLTALILALIVMLYFKRLHCPRNIIHMNMFLAFGVRAAFSLMKTVLLVNDIGFSTDVNQTESAITFLEDGRHWECKMFFTVFYYIIFASVMWLFNEGLYLQLILSVSVFSDKTRVRWFVLLGWGTPVVFVVPWIICRAYLDDMLCWNVHMYRGLYWIIHGPMMASVAINFVIFINTVRLLFTKLRATNGPDSKMQRYRKLFKSTLILIPLFAVYYMIFMLLPDDISTGLDLFKTYVEMLFNSFQGFLVAMLLCFLNHEVQNEVRVRWRRRSMQKSGSNSFMTLKPTFFCRSNIHRDTQPRDMQTDKHENKKGCGVTYRDLTKPLRPNVEGQAVSVYGQKNPAHVGNHTPHTAHRNSPHTGDVLQPLVAKRSQRSISVRHSGGQILTDCCTGHFDHEQHSINSNPSSKV